MYDLDVPTMLERLQKVPNATLLCSNPCFELWSLLHYTDQKIELTSETCVNLLATFIKQYKKGKLNLAAKQYLMANVSTASARAKKLQPYCNPSTTVYLLIEELSMLNATNQAR